MLLTVQRPPLSGLLGTTGPQGPQGVAGSIGPQGLSGVKPDYTHTQISASSSWIVNHNLGFKPNVSLYTMGGVEMLANVVHININQLIVQFSTATNGYCRTV